MSRNQETAESVSTCVLVQSPCLWICIWNTLLYCGRLSSKSNRKCEREECLTNEQELDSLKQQVRQWVISF